MSRTTSIKHVQQPAGTDKLMRICEHAVAIVEAIGIHKETHNLGYVIFMEDALGGDSISAQGTQIRTQATTTS